MITCVIKIKEVPGKGYYVDVLPEQSNATAKETRVASCMNAALDEVAKYLMSKGERGEMIERRDLDAVREIAKRKMREFDPESDP